VSADPIAAGVAALHDRIGTGAGPAGREWCTQLPVQIVELMERWDLTFTGESARAGFGGIAAFVTRTDGTPSVLKVTFSREARDLENELLATWNGRHSARLLERDDPGHARLLQRLDEPPLSALPDPVTAMAIAGELATALAITAPPGLPRMADFAPQIAAEMEEAPAERVRSLPRRDVQAAAATFRELGAEQPDTVLHGDLQGLNVLRHPGGGWAVIDPLGLVGEVALEALTMLRDRWEELPAVGPTQLLSQLRAFADGAGAPHSRVIAWTHARAVRAVLAGVDDDAGLHEWIASELDPRGAPR
jgi:streptomycin 6-kinase